MESKRKNILILGTGNVLLKDEGLGVKALEYLRDAYSLPPELTLVDGGVGGLSLISVIRGHNPVIIIDAIRKNGPPGTPYRIRGEKRLLRSGFKISSLHGLGIKELLALSDMEGKKEIVIIGMEPLDVSGGLRLSPLVQSRLPLLLELLRKELKRFGINLKKVRSPGARKRFPR